MVPLAEPTSERILKGLDCQTAPRGSFGQQRISGAVSNRKSAATQQHSTRRRLSEGTQDGASLKPNQNQIYILTSEPGDTDAGCVAQMRPTPQNQDGMPLARR